MPVLDFHGAVLLAFDIRSWHSGGEGGGEGGSGAAGGGGVGEGCGEGCGKGEDGAVARSSGSHCGGQVTPFPWRITLNLNRSVRIQRPDKAHGQYDDDSQHLSEWEV